MSSDEDLHTVLYSFDEEGNQTLYNGLNWISPEIGEHNITVWANDTSGNIASTAEYFTIVETNPPKLNFVSPTPSEGESLGSSTSSVVINVSVEEPNPDTLILCWNNLNYSYSYSEPFKNITMAVSSGNSYSFYIWTNDTARNSNQTATRSFSVKSSSGSIGGGGGGGSSQPEDKDTTGKTVTSTEVNVKIQIKAEFSSISKDKTGTIEIPDEEEMPITELKIKVNKKVTNVKIDMKVLNDKPPEGVQGVVGKVFKYLEIDHENLGDEDIDTMTIKFKVEKSWLKKEGADAEKVILKRYQDGEWKTLTTSKKDEDDDNFYYEAESPGLSHFAVAVEEAKKFDPALAEFMRSTLEQTPAPETTPPPLETLPMEVPSTVEEEKRGICGPTFILLIALLPGLIGIRRRES